MKPASLSTRASSPRPDLRAAWETRSRFRHAPNLPTWIGQILRRFLASRPRRFESFRPQWAAVLAPSWICPCSLLWPLQLGICDNRFGWCIRVPNPSFRPQNVILHALNGETPTVTGQVLGEGVGIRACLEALRPRWQAARKEAVEFNSNSAGPLRRGVGVAGMWYGCGNTSLPNPSTMRIGLKPDGRIALHQGAIDIGQGSATVVTQICADALGCPIDRFDLISGDTSITPDCGKTSASRQTFVTGQAAYMAGQELRRKILRMADACECAKIVFRDYRFEVQDGERRRSFTLPDLPVDAHGYVLTAEATFDPPTSPLDENGQGIPYAVFGFGAHLAEIEVDIELGTVKVLKITAAHDVGRAITPTLIEGQIEGGVAQGIGMALMEEFFPGKGENLHDYLIPSAGDIPPVESILIEDQSPIGPFGAKGIGEQAVIPTAPAVLNALHDAIGIRVRRIPATPDRVRAAILSARVAGEQRG